MAMNAMRNIWMSRRLSSTAILGREITNCPNGKVGAILMRDHRSVCPTKFTVMILAFIRDYIVITNAASSRLKRN